MLHPTFNNRLYPEPEILNEMNLFFFLLSQGAPMEVFLHGTESSLNVADCVVIDTRRSTDKVKEAQRESTHCSQSQWEEDSGQCLF